jgi:hypothetical protein
MAKARRGRAPRTPRHHDDRSRLGHFRADGAPKASFDTADDANRAALRLRLEEGMDLHPYRCDLCRDWHLGSVRSH